MWHITKRMITAVTALSAAPLICEAQEWAYFSDMPEGAGVYETALIDSDGFFSKTIHLWLRANYKYDHEPCASEEENFRDDHNKVNVYECRAQLDMAKESVYKLDILCNEKDIKVISVSTLTREGKQNTESKPIDTYPGSIGYDLVTTYCK